MTTEELLAATREMERISRERGGTTHHSRLNFLSPSTNHPTVPVAQIYATENECTVEQAVRELAYLQTILPHPASSSSTRPPLTQPAITPQVEPTTAPAILPPIASGPSTPGFHRRHDPAFVPRHLHSNPISDPSGHFLTTLPPVPGRTTQPLPSSLADWNVLPPLEFLDGGLLDDGFLRGIPTLANNNPFTSTSAQHSARSEIETAFRDRGISAGTTDPAAYSYSYSTDPRHRDTPASAVGYTHPRPVQSPFLNNGAYSSARTTRRPIGMPPPPPPPPSSHPSHPIPASFHDDGPNVRPTRPLAPPTRLSHPSHPRVSFRDGSRVPPPSSPTHRPPPPPSPRGHNPSHRHSSYHRSCLSDRVVKDEMGTFILIPWKDDGREEVLERGGYGGVVGRGGLLRRKELVVVEIRVGEEGKEEEEEEETVGGKGERAL